MRTEPKDGLQELIITLSQQPAKMTMDLSPRYSTGCKKRTEHLAEMKIQDDLLLDLIL